MPKIGVFDRTIGVLENALDLRMQKQQGIASNIANADTPGYAPVRIEFEERMRSALKSGDLQVAATHPQHIPIGPAGADGVRAKVFREPDATGIGDGNGVSVDQEMVDMAENQILYEAASQIISKKLGLLKYVAQDGR